MSEQPDAAPAWHKRPTCPGLWIAEWEDASTSLISMGEDSRWWPKHPQRFYGPIPSPPKETETNG